MKCTIHIFLFILLTLASFSKEMKLKLERIDVDFNGIVSSDITAVCYGTGSIILCSTDNGDSWKQKCIHDDSLDILRMVYNTNNFYGLLSRDYYVSGDKQAQSWKSIYTGIPAQISIEAKDDYVFILGLNEVHVYLNNEFQQKIKLIDTNIFTDLKIFKDQLIITGDKGKIIAIDLSNYRQNLIDFESLGLCNNCKPIRRLRIEGSNLYVAQGTTVLKTEDLLKWTVASMNISLYEVKNGQIYDLKALSTQYLINGLIAFYQSDFFGSVRINTDWQQRNVDILAFIDYRFINDSVVIAVGRDKLIANSIDKGVNWELRSNYPNAGFRMLNDSIYYSIQQNGRVYRTLNSGVTWLPPLFTDSSMTKFKTTAYAEYQDDGYGFILSYDSYNRNNLMVTYDYGNSYTLRNNNKLSGYLGVPPPSFIRTDEGYNVICPRVIASIPYTSLIKLDSGLNFVSYNNIYDSVEIRTVKKINDNEYLGLALDKHWPHYIDGIEKDFNYWFLKSSDKGETWEKQFELYMADTSLKPIINLFDWKLLMGGYQYDKNRIDTPYIGQLYLIDIEAGSRIRIFNNNEANYSVISGYGNFLIFGGVESIFVNFDYKSDLTKWEKFYCKGKNISVSSFNNKIIFYTFDVSTLITHVYQGSLDFTSEVEIQTEIKTNLYSYPPYPIPAKNKVMADIFWDTRFDFDKADIDIYSYTGALIADRDAVVIDRTNNYSGKLSWNCTGYVSGVYFIIIKHGDARRVIPIVVGE